MKKKIELKLIEVNEEMKSLEIHRFYWTSHRWRVLNAIREVLAEILK